MGIAVILVLILLLPLPAFSQEPFLELLKAKLEAVQARKGKVRAEFTYGKLLTEASAMRFEKLIVLEAKLKNQIAEAKEIKVKGEQ